MRGRYVRERVSPFALISTERQAVKGNKNDRLNGDIGHIIGKLTAIFHAATKNRIASRECGMSKINPASDLLGTLDVCEEHRAEVLEFFHITQGLTIKQDSLALLTRDEYKYHLSLRGDNAQRGVVGRLHATNAKAPSE